MASQSVPARTPTLPANIPHFRPRDTSRPIFQRIEDALDFFGKVRRSPGGGYYQIDAYSRDEGEQGLTVDTVLCIRDETAIRLSTLFATLGYMPSMSWHKSAFPLKPAPVPDIHPAIYKQPRDLGMVVIEQGAILDATA